MSPDATAIFSGVEPVLVECVSVCTAVAGERERLRGDAAITGGPGMVRPSSDACEFAVAKVTTIFNF